MSHTEVAANQEAKSQLELSPKLGLGIWVCLLGLLFAGMYLDPTLASIMVAVLGLGTPFLWLVWRRPEFGLLGMIFVTASFIGVDVIDVRLPIGGLDLRDVVFIALFGLALLQAAMRKELPLPWWPVSLSLLIFLGFAGFSALYALMYQGVAANWTFNELRPLVYFTFFFLTAWLVRQPKQLRILLMGLFILADVTAVIMIWQQALGRDNYLLSAMAGNWRVEDVGDGPVEFGTLRIIPPGHVLMFLMMTISFCFMVFPRYSLRLRAVFAFQFVLLNVGLVLTYTRAQWVAAALALAIITLVLPTSYKAQLARYAFAVLITLVFTVGLFGAEIQAAMRNTAFVDTLSERALSILTPWETLETGSLQWRVFETEEALRSISEYPLVGVGLGNSYRDVTLIRGEARGEKGNTRFTRYVHNNYLYMAVKMGIPAVLAFACFYLAFLFNGWHSYKTMRHSEYQQVTLAVLASAIGLLTWSITQPHFFQPDSAMIFGLMIGLVATLRYIDHAKSRAGGQLVGNDVS